MRDKLDPRLLDLVERANAGLAEPTETVDVLVGLDGPLDPEARRILVASGLSVRSEIETVLTGSIRICDVSRLAGSGHVVKIEASAPLYAETPVGGEG